MDKLSGCVFLSQCVSVCVWVCAPECASSPLSLCVCVCFVWLLSAASSFCGLSCVAGVAQTLENTIGLWLWLGFGFALFTQYFWHTKRNSPHCFGVERRVGLPLLLHSLFIFMVRSSRKTKTWKLTAITTHTFELRSLANALSLSRRVTLFYAIWRRALFCWLSLGLRSACARSFCCVLCARLRLAIDWTRRCLRCCARLRDSDCAAGYSRSRFIAKRSHAERARALTLCHLSRSLSAAKPRLRLTELHATVATATATMRQYFREFLLYFSFNKFPKFYL